MTIAEAWLGVTRVGTYDEAIALVNDNPYGNGTAIFTRDGGVARQFQFDVQAGMVGINVPIPVPVAYYSFGGWKASTVGPGAKAQAEPEGGEQFPPLDELDATVAAPETDADPAVSGAMDKLTARQNASGEQGSSKQEGFEAAVHRIKEQVLPRLLERVDPEAAATLNKDELADSDIPVKVVLGTIKNEVFNSSGF